MDQRLKMQALSSSLLSCLGGWGDFLPVTRIELSDGNNELRVFLPILGGSIYVCVEATGFQGFEISVRGLNSSAVRWLNDVLVPWSSVKVSASNQTIHVMKTAVNESDLEAGVRTVVDLLMNVRREEESGAFSMDQTIRMYWSSGVLNFGDWSGPKIVHRLTGRRTIQSNRLGYNSSRVLYTVGSILGWVKRDNVDIWGSGLMNRLNEDVIAERKKLRGVRIHAVRGRKTKEDIEQALGWEVPEVFGDPALLLPIVYPAEEASDRDKVAVVPHGVHRVYFKNIALPQEFEIVDVRNDVETVAKQISSSKAVVSTSLHGLITAQAYGVPWTWLQIGDRPLGGGSYKFEDFFTTLDESSVSRFLTDSTSLDRDTVLQAAKQANLPELGIDLNSLLAALPVAFSGG
ncbi:MAG: polysaccharide pyruvyl transferase family protein [Corynebacterium sp.]|nr:polysaccharide pyruvyl transferase family protein [Corynebacterium sp.]